MSNRVKNCSRDPRLPPATLDLPHEAVLFIDVTGRVVATNRAAARMFAADVDSLRGERIEALLSLNDGSFTDLLDDRTNAGVLPAQRARRADGEEFCAEVSLSPIGLPDDEPVAAIAVIRDVSDEPRPPMTEAHRQRLARVGEDTARVAHTLKNSLAGITALVDELTKSNGPPDREVLDLLRGEAERCSALVRELLQFTRRDSQGSLVSLNQVVDEAVSLSRLNAEPSVVILDKELSEETTCVVGVRSQLGQAVVNLLENARQAVEDREHPRIIVRTWVDDRSVFLSVSDNGCGIAPDLRDQIFEPFFTTKDPGAGTGLGLAIVERTMRDHGGSISVDSRPDTGATFVVELPRVAQPDD